MPLVYIGTKGTTVSVDQTHYTLRRKGKRIGRLPPSLMDEVIIEEGIEITRKALDRFGSTGVAVTFMGREGEVKARLVPPWRHDATARLEQARCFIDPTLRLKLARKLVSAKIRNQIHILRSYQKNRSCSRLGEVVAALLQHQRSLSAAPDVDSVMGYEGASAKAYYAIMAHYLCCDWTDFTGRNRRPPLDPVNAALSYCYAILTNRIHALCESAGLDPYIAYLHGSKPRRPGLALDLMEPFRPLLADRYVWRMFNRRELQRDDFQIPENPLESVIDGVRLHQEARQRIVSGFISWSQSTESDPSTDGRTCRAGGKMLLDMINRFRECAMHGKLDGFEPTCADDAETL